MTISSDSALKAFPTLGPASIANQYPTISPAPITSAVATSTTIAKTYGFAPSLIVPIYQAEVYQPLNPNPNVVMGVAKISVVPRTGYYPGYFFDSLA